MNRPWNTVAAAVLFLLHGALYAAPEPEPITLEIGNAGKPFPQLVLGAQEEVVNLAYLSKEHWEEIGATGVPMLRYPSGTPSDWFCWDAPEKGYWDPFGKTRKKMHPDAFYQKMAQYHLAALLTVNTSSYGAPGEEKRINPTRPASIRLGADYAAGWVRDANINQKANVKYWEIGNEVWCWMQANEYVNFVNIYAKAMRAVDPSIKLIACGLADDACFDAGWLDLSAEDPTWKKRIQNRNFQYDWDLSLLRGAKGSFDYLAEHIYFNGESIDPIANGRELFSKVSDNLVIDRAVKMIQDNAPEVRLAITEWMVNFSWDPVFKKYFTDLGHNTKQALTYQNSPTFCFFNTLVAADFIGKMAASGYVEIAIAHTLGNGLVRHWNQELSRPAAAPTLMPAGWAVKFWSEFSGGEILPVTFSHLRYDNFLHYRVPKIAAYALVPEKDRLNLILINRTPDETLTLKIPTQFNGRPVRKVTEHAVSAAGWSESMWVAMTEPARNPFRRTMRELPPGELQHYSAAPSRLICLALEL